MSLISRPLALRIVPLLLVGPLVACTPHDDRLPRQLPTPTTPNVPPVTVAQKEPAPAPKPEPKPEPAPEPKAKEPTEPVRPVPEPAPEPEIDPATLEDGVIVQKRILDAPRFADAGLLDTWCKESIARARGVRKRLQGPQATDAQTLADYDRMSIELDTVGNMAGLMFQVSPEKAVRDVAEKCTQDISRFATETSLDKAIYAALGKIDLAAADDLTRYFVDKTTRNLRRAGVEKDPAAQARISDINAELVVLGQEYSKTVNEDVRKIVVKADPENTAGLPEDWLKAHPPKEDGTFEVTTNYPDFFPFQNYAKNAALREQLYREYLQRGSAVNGERLKKVLALRKELAELLGYSGWTDYITEDKMTGSAAVVDAFIKDIESVIRPRADRDLAKLLERKKKDFPDATAIEVFDRFYYMNLVRAEGYDFDAQSVRQYFPYAKVKDGIFALYGKLFGVSFAPVADFPTWAPDVEAWELKRGDEVLGRFFLDMHPRDNKYKHAAMFPIQTGLEPDAATGRERRLAWGALVCNFPKPTADDAALMEHSDVVTFFHEFGHLIHQLLAQKGRYLDLSGINVEWDFVEAPSQLLEEWAWDAKVLAGFAKNDKGKAIPKDVVARMVKAEEFGQGVDLQRQVYLTAYSFYIHQADPATLDLDAFTVELTKKHAPFPPFEGDKLYANFGHLLGYSAIYYTYQWSLAIAKDLFGRFKAKGLLDPKVAAEYTEKVLHPGGTAKADTLIESFLGRPRNLDAYKAWIQSGP